MKKILFGTVAAFCIFCTGVKAADFYVQKISVDGLQRVEKETVLAYLGMKTNEKVSSDKLDSAFKNLYATGLFSDIKMNTQNDGTLKITVVESPLIGERAFDGNKKLDDKILETEVQSGPNTIYSRAKVQQDVQRILEVYKRAGRYAVEVEPKIIERDENRIDLIFEIDEGPEAKIDKQD